MERECNGHGLYGCKVDEKGWLLKLEEKWYCSNHYELKSKETSGSSDPHDLGCLVIMVGICLLILTVWFVSHH